MASVTRVSWLAAVPEFKTAIVYVRISSGRIDGAEADLAAVMRAISVVTVFEVEEPDCGVWPAQPTNVYVHVGVTWYRAGAGATGMESTRSWNVASRRVFCCHGANRGAGDGVGARRRAVQPEAAGDE